MAHAAPTSRTSRTARTPDIFGAQAHAVGQWAIPVVSGLVYGYWVAARDRSGGPITGWNLLLGFASTIVFAAACVGILMMAPHVKRELHALMWTAFAGIAVGFLYSAGGPSVLQSIRMGLLIAATVFAMTFYWYYTHEDAVGHRDR